MSGRASIERDGDGLRIHIDARGMTPDEAAAAARDAIAEADALIEERAEDRAWEILGRLGIRREKWEPIVNRSREG